MAPSEKLPQLLASSLIKGLPVGQNVQFTALVAHVDAGMDRRGRTFLTLGLRGTDNVLFTARWWNYTAPSEQWPCSGTIYLCTAKIDVYQGQHQFHIQSMTSAPEVPLLAFARATRRSPRELETTLQALIMTLRPSLVHLADYVESRLWAWSKEEAPSCAAPHSDGNSDGTYRAIGTTLLCSEADIATLSEQAPMVRKAGMHSNDQ